MLNVCDIPNLREIVGKVINYVSVAGKADTGRLSTKLNAFWF